jgi:hypothetical protein
VAIFLPSVIIGASSRDDSPTLLTVSPEFCSVKSMATPARTFTISRHRKQPHLAGRTVGILGHSSEPCCFSTEKPSVHRRFFQDRGNPPYASR